MTEGNKIEWIKKAGIRAIWTFAETMLGFVTVGQAISEITWLHAISVSTVAAIVSLLKSIPGLPELKKSEVSGEIVIDPETMNAAISFKDEDSANLIPGSTVSFNVVPLKSDVNEGDKDDSDI